MHDHEKTREQLVAELAELRERLAAIEGADNDVAPSNPRWHSLVENAPVFILVLDREHRVRFINRTSSSATPSELIGKHCGDLVVPEYRDTVQSCLESVFDTGRPACYEAQSYCQDGRIQWYANHVGPVFDHGEVVAVSIIAEEITGRKQAEEEQSRSHAILNAAIDCLPFDLFGLGPDGRYMLQNAVSRRHSPDAIGKTPEEVCPDEHDLAIWLDNNRRAFAGERVEGEVELTIEGEQRHYHNILTPIRSGEAFYGIVGVNVDITARVRAERALRRSEGRFRKIFEEGPLGIGLLDRNLQLQHVNQRFCEMLGFSEEEILARGVAGITHAEDWESDRDLALRLLRGEMPYYTLEKRYVRKDGSVFWGQLTTSVMQDPAGQAACIGMVEDITERKLAEDGLRRARDELEQRVEERTAALVQANEELQREAEERQLADEALRENERKYRALVETSPDALVVSDLEGRILFASPQAVRMYGAEDAGELCGQEATNLVAPEDGERIEAGLAEVQEEGVRRGREFTVLRKDGSRIPAEVSSAVIHDANGRPTAVMALVRDITEGKQAQAALQQRHDELETIYNGIVEGLLITDIETKRFVRVNRALCRMLGYSAEELLKASIQDIHPPEEVPNDLERFLAAAEGRVSINEERPVLRKDGAVFYADISGHQITYEGRPCLLALFRDVTERRELAEALRQSEERYRTVVEDQTEVIIRLKTDGTLIFVNDVYCRFFGITREKALGTTWHPLAVADDVPMIERRLRTLSPDNPIVVVENRVYSQQREVRWMQFVNRGFFDETGHLVEIQSVGRDITDRKQAEQAVERERRTLFHMLQASDHERQLIAYDIHDGLAQQLAAATMHFQVFEHLQKQAPTKAKTAYDAGVEMVQHAHSESRRLISGVRPPALDESGVAVAVAHLVHEVRERRGHKIEYHDDVAFVRLPPILENAIYRITHEALSNACEHSGSQNVRVSLIQEGELLRLEVQDWGVGFDPGSVDENRFGLEGIRERARLLGGQCAIDSEPGKGTRVRVTLPVVEQE